MRSYSLIEFVMVVAIIAVIAAIGMPVLFETADSWSLASRFQDFAVQRAIVTANRISKEARRISDNNAVNAAASSQFNFTFKDLSDNNLTVDYALSANTIIRTTGAEADGLTDNINSLAFTYYNDTEGVPASNSDIRRIRIDFAISAAGLPLNFQFQVRPQNTRRLGEKFK